MPNFSMCSLQLESIIEDDKNQTLKIVFIIKNINILCKSYSLAIGNLINDPIILRFEVNIMFLKPQTKHF